MPLTLRSVVPEEAEESGETFNVSHNQVGVHEQLPVDQVTFVTDGRRTGHDVLFSFFRNHGQRVHNVVEHAEDNAEKER